MAKKNENGNIIKANSRDNYTEIDIPDIGVGRVTTLGTIILSTLMIENGIKQRADVLNSVIEYLGIQPEDFNKMRRNRSKWGKLDYDNDEKYSWE